MKEAMAIYPEQLEAIRIYIDALNGADAKVATLEHQELRPQLDRIPVVQDEDVIGHLIDENGGMWAFRPVVVGED